MQIVRGGRTGVKNKIEHMYGLDAGLSLSLAGDQDEIPPERLSALAAVLERPGEIVLAGDGSRPNPGHEADWLTEHLGRGEHRTGAVAPILTVGKSLSILAEHDADVDAAVREALEAGARAYTEYVSTHAVTRVGPAGEQVEVPIDPSSVRAISWIHGHSAAGDPHRHAHVLISASVRAESDEKWRAMATTHFFQDVAPAAGAEARIAMLRVLRERGLELDPLNMELAGLDERAEKQLERFSTMAGLVEAYEETGVTHDTAWQAARRAIRDDTRHPVNRDMQAEQLERVREAVRDWRAQTWTIPGKDAEIEVKISQPEALEHALDALIRTDGGREAVLTYHDIRSDGAWHKLVNELEQAREREREITIDDAVESLTRAVEAGQTITRVALAGHARVVADTLSLDEVATKIYLEQHFLSIEGRRGLVATKTVQADLELADRAREVMAETPTVEQAMEHTVGLSVIGGVAGAGKTYSAMQAARTTWAREQGNIWILSRNAKTAFELAGSIREALAEGGGDPARVTAMPLADPRWREHVERGDRIIVDEFVLAEREQLELLVALARNSSVTLMGDEWQQRAIETPTAAMTLAGVAMELGQPRLVESRRCEAWRDLHDDLRLASTDEAARERAAEKLQIKEVQTVSEAVELAQRAGATILTRSNELAAEAAREHEREIEGERVAIQRGVMLGVGDEVVFRRIVRTGEGLDRRIVGRTGELARIAEIKDNEIELEVGDERRREVIERRTAREALSSGQAMTIDAAQGLTLDRAAVVITGNEDSHALYSAATRGRQEPLIILVRGGAETEESRARGDDDRSAKEIVRDVLERSDRWCVLDLEQEQAKDIARQLGERGQDELAQRLMARYGSAGEKEREQKQELVQQQFVEVDDEYQLRLAREKLQVRGGEHLKDVLERAQELGIERDLADKIWTEQWREWRKLQLQQRRQIDRERGLGL